MAVDEQIVSTDRFAFSSSIAADVWHPQKDAKAYEWWYFDALSDDGNEAIVIVFLDNFIYSPRYNKAGSSQRFPAISFTYFRDGKPLYRSVSEFPHDQFNANQDTPECRIGDSSFKFESAAYGSGYSLSINAELKGGKRLEANLEWLSVEADLSPDAFCYADSRHCWNMVAPRSDVSGKITLFDKHNKQHQVWTFRGTGYHDHNLDNRWLAKTVDYWHWGRSHYSDATAVFYRCREFGIDEPSTKLMVIRDGKLETRNVEYQEQNYIRDKFGIRYPSSLHLVADDGTALSVKPFTVIDSSFYYLRFLSEIKLTLEDGRERTTTGITEFISPKAVKHRWLNWISDFRNKNKGKGSVFS